MRGAPDRRGSALGGAALLPTALAAVLVTVPAVAQGFGYLAFPLPLFPLLPFAAFVLGLALSGEIRTITLRAASVGLLTVGALQLIALFGAQPLIVGVPAALLAAAAVAWRFPIAMLLSMIVVSGTYGTLDAYLKLKHGIYVDLVLASAWMATIWRLVRYGSPQRAWVWPGVAAVGIYMAITVLELPLAPESSAALRSLRSSTWYAMTFLLIAYAPLPSGASRRLARGVLLVATVVGAYAVLRWQIGPSQKEATLAAISSYTNFVDGKLGVFGSFTSRKELAAWAAFAMPLCLAYAIGMKDAWRLVAAAGAALAAVAVFVSEVRIGLLAGVAGTVVTFALVQASRGLPGLRLGATLASLLLVLAVGVGGFALAASSSSGASARFAKIFNPSTDLSVAGRTYKWRTAWSEIQSAPFGHGLGSAGVGQIRDGRFVTIASFDLDNGYLKVAYEQGLALAVLYVVALLALLLGLALRTLAASRPGDAVFGAAGCGALVVLLALMTAGVYQEGLPALLGWVLVGIGVRSFAAVPAPAHVRSSRVVPAELGLAPVRAT